MKIVIPGGSGQIGSVLARHFHQQGHAVTVLSRVPRAAPWQVIRWDAQTAGPWTAGAGAERHLHQPDRDERELPLSHGENRREMYDSRIVSTRLLNDVMASLQHPPRLWLNASTATIYRHALDRPMDETGELGGEEPGAPDTWNFSIKIAKDWEAAFFAGQTRNTRKIAMRSSITFIAGKGGVLEVLSNLVRSGLGGSQGSGAQYVSWIHEADFVRAVDFLIANETLTGPVNICSPNPLEKSRIHARSSRFLATTGWLCCSFMDDRNRQFPTAHRIRTRSQEPLGHPRQTHERRFLLHLSRMAGGGAGAGYPLSIRFGYSSGLLLLS